jgi:hypothetical protein
VGAWAGRRWTGEGVGPGSGTLGALFERDEELESYDVWEPVSRIDDLL